MANLNLTGSSFFLGQTNFTGAGAQGTEFTVDNAEASQINMLSDPSSILGQPYSSWNNTGKLAENYASDDANLDIGEAVRMDLVGNGILTDDPWLRVTRFDRYDVSIKMADGRIVTGVGVIISAKGTDGKTYQSMVFGDGLVARLNDTGENITKITLGTYVPTGSGGTGLDLTQVFQLGNFANELADYAVVPCFTRGTRIATIQGEQKIEDLAIGDMVVTADHGLQEIRWIGSRRVPAEGKLAPIVFARGAIGNSRKLAVSPQHRMLITGPRAEMLFGESEVLVPAKSLVNDHDVRIKTGGWVKYYHILLDAHEVIFANGAPAESLYLGPQALRGFDGADREEILALFPELEARIDQGAPPQGARKFLTVRQGRALSASASEPS